MDITTTPFTNTLPIRHPILSKGKSAEIKVVYFSIPEMRVIASRQRYTLLKANEMESRYKFENPDDGFSALITVGRDGLVED